MSEKYISRTNPYLCQRNFSTILSIRKRFILDKKGRRKEVVLQMNDYKKILEQLEELDEIKAYDRAKRAKEKPIPFEQAIE